MTDETQPPLDPYRAWDIVARLRDEIETLRRERDEVISLAEHTEQQRKEVALLLREAGEVLEPFAAIERRQWAGTVYEGAADDKGILYHYESKTCVTVGDFRRASALLAKIKGEGGCTA